MLPSASSATAGTRSGLTESIATSCDASSASAESGTEDARGEDGGVLRVVDAYAGDRNSRRHLHDREHGVEAVEDALRRAQRDADHRKVGVRGDRARQSGGQTG